MDESTPLDNVAKDTSAAALNSETANNDAASVNAPEDPANEPNGTEIKADETETKPEEPKLYAGKYKSVEELENGYKEAEKYINKANELEKQLKSYTDAEQKAAAERENVAKQAGFDNETQQRLFYDVKNHEFKRYVEALSTVSGENFAKAQNALLRYQQTGNANDLAAVKSCFLPDVIEAIAKDTAKFEAQKSSEYYQYQENLSWKNKKAALEQFAKDTGDWLNPKERQEIVGLAVNITNGDIDLPTLKNLIDACEKQAVDRYIAEQKAAAENNEAQNSLTPPNAAPSGNGEHWFSNADVAAMSESEFDKNAKKIEEQILLEKSGKLPKMLTY